MPCEETPPWGVTLISFLFCQRDLRHNGGVLPRGGRDLKIRFVAATTFWRRCATAVFLLSLMPVSRTIRCWAFFHWSRGFKNRDVTRCEWERGRGRSHSGNRHAQNSKSSSVKFLK